MKTLKSLIILTILISLSFVSCKKDDIEPSVTPKPNSMDKLVASQNFDWKTTKDYQFILNGKSKSVIKIVSENGTIYHKGAFKSSSPYQIKLTLPTYETKIHLIYNGTDIIINLNQYVITYNFKSIR